MNKVLCPNCGEVIFENPECEANGIITCDKCNNKIKWECNGKNTITNFYVYNLVIVFFPLHREIYIKKTFFI